MGAGGGGERDLHKGWTWNTVPAPTTASRDCCCCRLPPVYWPGLLSRACLRTCVSDTAACETPGSSSKPRSTEPEQAPHVMPPTCSRVVCSLSASASPVSTLCSDCSRQSKPQPSTAATNCSGLHCEPSKWTCAGRRQTGERDQQCAGMAGCQTDRAAAAGRWCWQTGRKGCRTPPC